MLLNFITLVLILLIATYLSNQGLFSAILIFITATFASILAGALFEPLENYLAGWKPEWARGLTFLLLFGIAFLICRLAADFAVPKNIKVPLLFNRILGGLFGLLASLIIVGSLLIGVQMLAVPTAIFGFDRFPSADGMQVYGEQAGNKVPVLGTLASSHNIWFAPDRFTLAFWKLASGHSLGGDRPFAAVHPDLLTESYGYRNTVQAGNTTTLPPDLLNVNSAWISADPDVISKLQITEPGKAALVVRAEITSSAEPPKVSVDSGSSGSDVKPYFFVTPSEVRVVTNAGNQHFAIGYIEKGREFKPLPLDSGQLADDPTAAGKIVEDWVFQLDADEKPLFIEIKRARSNPIASILKPIANPADPKSDYKALATTDYPPRAYRQTQGSAKIVLTGFDNTKFDSVTVLAVIRSTTNKVARPIFGPSYANINAARVQIDQGSGPWSTGAGKSGVPNAEEINNAYRVLQPFVNGAPDDHVFWDEFLPYCFNGQSTTDGPHNLIALPKYFTDTVLPALQSSTLAQGTIDASGKLILPDLPKGPVAIIALAKNDKGVYIWALNKDIASKAETEFDLTPSAQFSCVLK